MCYLPKAALFSSILAVAALFPLSTARAGHSAVIRVTSGGHSVGHSFAPYTLQRVPGYPTYHFQFNSHHVRGDFRHFWFSPSRINFPFQ